VNAIGKFIPKLGAECRLTIRNDVREDSAGSGYGYGLVIIERICDRLQWQYQIEEAANEFMVRIRFSA
jgi:hypothetical protein